MLILLEGPDGAGKSTLAELIAEKCGAKILHKGPIQRDVISEYTLDLQWYRPGQGDDVVCDRWHLGEEVYGPLLRERSAFDPATLAHVEKTLNARGALLVILDPPVRVLRGRLGERGDDLITPEQVDRVSQAYREVLRGTNLPIVRLTEYDPDFAADLLVKSARHLEERCARLNPFPTYAGDLQPGCLLLGDTRNRNRGEPPHEAALTPGPATAGRYLLDALPSRVLRGCGLSNACEEDVAGLWETLQQPRTVAMGVNAARACREAGISFGVVPHPQFIRRFHHSASSEYGQLIRETLLSGKDQIGWRPSVPST